MTRSSWVGVHCRSKVSVQNSHAGQHDESRHNFKVMYIHQLGHYASLLSVLFFFRDLRLYLCLFKCDVYFLMKLWSK